MKYFSINLTKCVQDLYDKNDKSLMNTIKEEVNKCSDIPCSKIGRLNIAKMSVLSNLINRFSAIPIKIPESYFVDTDKLILKLTWKGKRPRITETILKEKNKVREPKLTLPDFKTYYKATAIKTVWYW